MMQISSRAATAVESLMAQKFCAAFSQLHRATDKMLCRTLSGPRIRTYSNDSDWWRNSAWPTWLSSCSPLTWEWCPWTPRHLILRCVLLSSCSSPRGIWHPSGIQKIVCITKTSRVGSEVLVDVREFGNNILWAFTGKSDKFASVVLGTVWSRPQNMRTFFLACFLVRHRIPTVRPFGAGCTEGVFSAGEQWERATGIFRKYLPFMGNVGKQPLHKGIFRLYVK